jgi:AraC family transcriptional regulator
MKIVDQTIASLGSPMWIEPLGMPDRSGSVIARWRHVNAQLQIATADAIRVCLSLSTGQQVRHAERDRSLSKSVLAGDVIVLRPGIATETRLEGDAEIVQVFIEPESLGQMASSQVSETLVGPPSDALKRAVVRLFVAARHDDWEGRRAAEILLRKEVRASLLAAPADDVREPEVLPPAVIRRAERLIAEALERPSPASPTLRELAAAARLSTNHFIRSFRKVRGTTPHQVVMTRRCQRAMDLLRQPHLTVADVSDAAGYSSPAYFVASFRQQLGVTPGAYQRAVAPQR